MSTIPLSEAQSNLPLLVNQVSELNEPITILGETNKAVLISEENWRGIQETIYLLSIPTLGESIKEGLLTPIDECSMELDW